MGTRGVCPTDLAKLGWAVSTIMAGLGVPLGSVLPETLVAEVGRLPNVVRELELATARRVVHRVLAMFELHYQGLDRMALSGGWAPSSPMRSVMSSRKTAPPSPATWPMLP
jgi:hypothetical protein